MRTLAIITVVFCVATRYAEAGYVQATLSVSPSAIDEGGSTTATLTLTNAPHAAGYHHSERYGSYLEDHYYEGSGSLQSFSGNLNPGNGEPSVSLSGSPGNSSFSVSRNITYDLPGTYAASFAGVAVSVEDYYYHLFRYHRTSIFSGHWDYLNTVDYTETNTVNINASTTVNVANTDPWIGNLTWAAEVGLGDAFAFGATAYDAGLAGGDALTFAYDLTGDGLYDDLVQAGVTSSSGTWQFDTEGLHRVNVRVTDGYGGTASAYFDVNVVADTTIAPEPGTLSLMACGGLGLVGGWMRKRRRVPRAA